MHSRLLPAATLALFLGACQPAAAPPAASPSAPSTAAASPSATPSATPLADGPPTVGGLYAAHGACPFEGCDLRVWRVLKPIELRADPNPSAAIVATAAPGEWVRAVESVDFIMPQRGVVVADLGMLKPGDVIYLLDDLGEGFYQVWVRGELHQWSDDGSRDAADPTIRGGVKWTPGPEEQTAASVAPTTPPRGGWWVRVQRDSGGSGWTRAGENFACMGVIDASEECEAHQRPAPN